jgi:3D (Asp-Asp-Asp) domain-containing protein
MMPSFAAARWVNLALLLATTGLQPGTARRTADNTPQEPATENTIQRICRVTAYCNRGTTASGVPSGEGQCAAPLDIPFGARVYIPELNRTFVATDRTAKRFRHNTVDIFMPTRAECLGFGRRYLVCEITLPSE